MAGLKYERNTRAQKFVEHFIRTSSVCESVKAAGYACSTRASMDRQGQYLMNNPDVQKAIAAAQQEIKAASRVGTEEKRMKLWSIACKHEDDNPDSAIRAIHELNVMDGDLKGGNSAAFSIEQAIMMVTQQR